MKISHQGSCGLLLDGELVCSNAIRALNQYPPDGTIFKSITASPVQALSHFCGVTSDDQVICWGNNSQQQLQVPVGFP